MIYTSRFIQYTVWISSKWEWVVEDVFPLCCTLLHRLLLVVEALLPVVQGGWAETLSDLLAVEQKVAVRVGFKGEVHLNGLECLLIVPFLLYLWGIVRHSGWGTGFGLSGELLKDVLVDDFLLGEFETVMVGDDVLLCLEASPLLHLERNRTAFFDGDGCSVKHGVSDLRCFC